MLEIRLIRIMKILLLFACFALNNANPDDDEPSIMFVMQRKVDVKINDFTSLGCIAQGNQLSNFTWTRRRTSLDGIELENSTSTYDSHKNQVTMSIQFPRVSLEHSGGYFCSADSLRGTIAALVYLHVMDVPHLRIGRVAAAGVDSISMNWSLSDDAVDPDLRMSIQYIENGTGKWQPYRWRLLTISGSDLLIGFEKNTAYRLKIVASNSVGDSPAVYSDWITTWDKDPDFVPEIWINATTSQSVTIGWSMVPAELQDKLYWYRISITPDFNHWWQRRKHKYESYDSGGFIFEYLNPETRYKFKVAACTHYRHNCGDYSTEIEAITVDTSAGPEFVPSVIVEETTSDSIRISWSRPPLELRYRVRQYKVTATHLDGILGPIDMPETVNSYVFQNLTSGTKYGIKVAVCTDSKTQCGPWSTEHEVTAISKGVKPEATIMALIIALNYLLKFAL